MKSLACIKMVIHILLAKMTIINNNSSSNNKWLELINASPSNREDEFIKFELLILIMLFKAIRFIYEIY